MEKLDVYASTRKGQLGRPPLFAELALETQETVQGQLLVALETACAIRPVPVQLVMKLREMVDTNIDATVLTEGLVIKDKMGRQRDNFGPYADFDERLRPQIRRWMRTVRNNKVRQFADRLTRAALASVSADEHEGLSSRAS